MSIVQFKINAEGVGQTTEGFSFQFALQIRGKDRCLVRGGVGYSD